LVYRPQPLRYALMLVGLLTLLIVGAFEWRRRHLTYEIVGSAPDAGGPILLPTFSSLRHLAAVVSPRAPALPSERQRGRSTAAAHLDDLDIEEEPVEGVEAENEAGAPVTASQLRRLAT